MSKYLPNALSVFVVLLILANYFGAFADLDWTWQVRAGRDIVADGHLRLTDHSTYTINGAILQDFEWLYEVILWCIWSMVGMGGLKFLKLLLVVTPLLLVARQLRRESVRWHGIALALGLAIFILTPAWNLRPLFCSTIGLLLTTAMLHNHCTGKQPLSWNLPLIMLAWANLHPGVIMGQGLLAGAIAWEWLNRWLQFNKPLTGQPLMRLTYIGGMAFAATFLSPNPIDRLSYPFKPELAHPIMRIFAEMQPLYTFLDQPPYAVALIYLVALLVLVTVVRNWRAYRLWELSLLAGLACLGNFAFRSAMDWLLVMLILGAPHLRDLLAELGRSDARRWWANAVLRMDRGLKKTLQSPLFRWRPFWPVLTCIVLLSVSLIPPLSRAMPVQDSHEWPVAALDHVKHAGWSGNFFSPPDYGAYIGWRLGEHGKVYADTRGFYFPPTILEDSHYVPQLGPEWRERLDRVLDSGTDFFLLEASGPRGALWETLAPHTGTPLFLDDQCVLLSAEQVRAALFVRDAEAAASLPAQDSEKRASSAGRPTRTSPW